MIFDHGHNFPEIFGTADFFFNITEREEFIADQFAQFFCKLLLSFWKNTLDGDPEDSFGLTGVEKHFNSNPVSHPPNKGRDQWDQHQPIVHNEGIK